MHIQDAFSCLLQWRTVSQKYPGEEIFVFFEYCLKHVANSNAMLLQDLFVLYELKEKKRGFFVEFGASDGVEDSNTLLLEKSYDWNGILAEPSRQWPEALKKNRHCTLDFRCVWTTTGSQIEFNQTPKANLSTINQFSGFDTNAAARKAGTKYQVETVTLTDLLRQQSAPRSIDYISINTQGSEFDILNAFDFNAFDVKIFTVGYHVPMARDKIHTLMTSKGYIRKFEAFSNLDSWYVKKS
jgi:FkbM family methyltransferase